MLLRISAAALALCVSTTAAAEQVRFVTCPIYRDTNLRDSDPSQTGRRTGCWLADDPETGKRYEVNESWSKPDWNYAVLVEGEVDESMADVCGGTTLSPVFTSVLYDRKCPARMLQAEGYTGRKPTFSKRYVMPLSVERELPEPPYETTTFSPVYDFDSDFMIWNLSDYALDLAINYIKVANPSKVIITGFAATEPVEVSGVTLQERPEVAQSRVDGIVTSMLRMGVSEDLIETRVETDAQPSDTPYADGLIEPSRRRVDIKVVVD